MLHPEILTYKHIQYFGKSKLFWRPTNHLNLQEFYSEIEDDTNVAGDIFGGALPYKARIFQGRVLLLKPHGCVRFRSKISEDSERTLVRLVGVASGIQPLPMPMAGRREPFIVAPSTSKSYHQKYVKNILSLVKDLKSRKACCNRIFICFKRPSY